MYAFIIELLIVFGGYEDVIHIYDEPSFCNLFGEDHVHHGLEGSRRVC